MLRLLRFTVRLVGWLLTPLIAWAASFFGAWAGAALAAGVRGAIGALAVTIAGAAVTGIGATMLWMRLLRRSPQLQQALQVTGEGIPRAALEPIGQGREEPTP